MDLGESAGKAPKGTVGATNKVQSQTHMFMNRSQASENRSGGKAGKSAIHMVSGFAARQRLVLGQVKGSEKSNEIVAIPKLLDMLAIEGAIVTIDAIGCQRAIAEKIVAKKAGYVSPAARNRGMGRRAPREPVSG